VPAAVLTAVGGLWEMRNGPEYLYEALDFVAKGKVKVITETYSSMKLPKLISVLSTAKPASERFSPCSSRVRAKNGELE